MTEKDFQKFFGEWITTQTDIKTTIAFELKINKGTSIRFDAVQEHQIEALYNAKHTKLYYKINDMPYGTPCGNCGSFNASKIRFTNKKPFDCFILNKVESYIVIWNYVPRVRKGERTMIWVDIDDWIKWEMESDRKSIKIEELMEKGRIVYF